MVCVIDEAEVRALIDWNDAIGKVERAYRAAAEGGAAVSQPASMHLHGAAGTSFKVKGAVLAYDDVAGFRLIGDTTGENAGGSSYVYLVGARTATPFALVSESWLHRLRTAVTGLVACRALAPATVSAIALVGTGRIAEEFVRIAHKGFPHIPIIIASRTKGRADEAVRTWQSMTPNPLAAADSIPEGISSGDVVVTLSDADARLFSAKDIRPTALVCAMGGRHEFDRDVLDASAAFIVDEFDFVCTAGNGAHWISSGQITRQELERRVDATIGEVLVGRKPIGRNGMTLAIIQGMAICDVALAKLAYDRKRGLRS